MASGLLLAALAVGRRRRSPPASGTALVLALFALGGASAASVFAACGRMIMGWFARTRARPRHGDPPDRAAARRRRRGARAARAGAAVRRVRRDGGARRALPARGAPGDRRGARPGAAAAGAGRAPASPYRTPVLWRVHAASAMLVVPQFAVSAFATEYLVRQQGWSTTAAGAFVAVIQIAGAVGRIGSGVWSDRVGSRLRPMRQLAVGAALVLLTFALGDAVAPWLAIAALVVGGDRHGRRQRAGVHRRRRDRRADVVGPGAGRAEHRAEHRSARSPRSRSARSSGRRATRSGSRWPPSRRSRRSASLRSVTSRTRPGSRPPALVRSAATGPHPAARKV